MTSKAVITHKQPQYFLIISLITLTVLSCKRGIKDIQEHETIEEEQRSSPNLNEILETQLPAISLNIENKQLAYSSAKGQDCSGIFHQIKDSIKFKNDKLIIEESYIFPKKNTSRSSKQIALWYHVNNNFTIVIDATEHTDKIVPGAVLFFGHSGTKYSPTTIEELTSPHDGIINHVAVVTSVKRNSEGELEEYTMMHAHNKRRPASRSTSKEIQSSYNDLPAFGNWNQQLVGIATIHTKAG